MDNIELAKRNVRHWLAHEGIRHQNPQADKAEVERLLRQRLQLGLSMTEQELLVDCLRRLNSVAIT